MIQEQLDQGVYLKDIAHGLGVHPKTVRRAMTRGAPPARGRRREKFVKLNPYLEKIDALLAENVWNARVILREIQALGYTGKETVLRDYIQPKRVLRPSKATVRFETEPGDQLQHDWGEIETVIAGVPTKVYFAVNTLGFSRRFHAFCAPVADAEHTYESVVRAFEWFGGVTATVLVDNQKSAVLHHSPGEITFNTRFAALAKHYGFRPKACRPYRARTKGKVERMVGYVKHHFFVRYRSFESWAHLNQQLEAWLREEADQREHGTVREIVAERFAREAPALRALPPHRFDTSYYEPRQVGWDGYVEVRGNRYSVPITHAGAAVEIRIQLDGGLRIVANGQPVAEHRLSPPEAGWVTVPAHHRALWEHLKVETRPLSAYVDHLTEAAPCN